MKTETTIFRFDDICLNADIELANDIASLLKEHVPNSRIIYAVSPMVHDLSDSGDEITRQRIFPKILNAHSDHRVFYKVDLCGIPNDLPDWVELASHGLIHVDHRLLDYSAQEMSILVSSSLVKAKTFIPPFNKWNKDTEKICKEHGINLVKFEDGWRCLEYNDYTPLIKLWYLHHREFTLDSVKKWLNV